MNQSQNSDQSLAGQAEQAATPRYSFVADDGPLGGRFEWSSACRLLVEEQDRLYKNYWSQNAAEQTRCREWVGAITAQHPDFLEGLLAKADTLYFPDGSSVVRRKLKIYAEAIERAEALIPPDFKGRISWSCTENQFFLRLLYADMVLNLLQGSLRRALKMARRQLRLNPDDNLGVRYFLPLLLMTTWQFDAAFNALERIEQDMETDGGAYFVSSLLYGIDGDYGAALQDFLHALFLYPPLRDVVARQDEHFEPIHQSRLRRISPDPATLAQQYVLALGCAPQLDKLFKALLCQPCVRYAEVALEKTFHRNPKQWIAELEEAALKMVDELANLTQDPPSGGTHSVTLH